MLVTFPKAHVPMWVVDPISAIRARRDALKATDPFLLVKVRVPRASAPQPVAACNVCGELFYAWAQVPRHTNHVIADSNE